MKKITLLLTLSTLISCSSYKYIPRFTSLEKIVEIKQGMTKTEVDNLLGVKPYDIKELETDGSLVLLYKYRVMNRALLKEDSVQPTNGSDAWGGFGDLYITYSKDNKVVNFKSCIECGKTEQYINKK